VKLIDTSAWVHQLRRRGDPAIRARVEALLLAGQAAWCPIVRLELWAGVGNDHERHVLRDLATTLLELEITGETWEAAVELGDRCRRAGYAVPAPDLLIAACARQYEVEVEHFDAHFDALMKL
jgi:predicted nucleic acid-binding protein